VREGTITATQLRKRCLALLNEVGPQGIIVTKRGKPVAKLIPIESESAALIGSLKDKIRIRGNILSSGLEW
jgi:prevent-host-death family protein